MEEQAKLEGKTPVLILKEKNKKGELVVLRLSDFVELVDRVENIINVFWLNEVPQKVEFWRTK